MTRRVLVLGDPGYQDEPFASLVLESEFRMAEGQVICVDNRTQGNLRALIEEIVSNHLDQGLLIADGPSAAHDSIIILGGDIDDYPEAVAARFPTIVTAHR